MAATEARPLFATSTKMCRLALESGNGLRVVCNSRLRVAGAAHDPGQGCQAIGMLRASRNKFFPDGKRSAMISLSLNQVAAHESQVSQAAQRFRCRDSLRGEFLSNRQSLPVQLLSAGKVAAVSGIIA